MYNFVESERNYRLVELKIKFQKETDFVYLKKFKGILKKVSKKWQTHESEPFFRFKPVLQLRNFSKIEFTLFK